MRGVSAIHRKYPKDPLSISKLPLPVPLKPESRRTPEVDPNHPLYGFFRKDKDTSLPTPEEDHMHGMKFIEESYLRH